MYIHLLIYLHLYDLFFNAGMMIEEPFQRALKLEVFANTIRRDLSDLLHVTNISPTPLNITSEALGSLHARDLINPCEWYSQRLLA